MDLREFLQKSVEGELSPEEQEKFLLEKSELSCEELVEVVKFLKEQQVREVDFPDAIDVCGTGGSGLARINTSTISSFILAEKGVRVAKHGNRAASGRFGSFDLLEKLGVDIESGECARPGLLFMFAPLYHPVMRHFGEVRKKIGKPTFFNILGPLLNPADVTRQIIGTTFRHKMDLIAETCKLLGKERVFVVSGEDGLDEVTLTGKTHVVELNNGKIERYVIEPEDFGVERASFEEIKGGDAEFNTKIARDILEGKCKTRHLDLVLVNTALALKLAGKVDDLKEGYELAAGSLGAAGLPVAVPEILQEIVENKKKEVEERKSRCSLDELGAEASDRDFAEALRGARGSGQGVALIAEIKKSSPSEGAIHKGYFSPAEIAEKYEKAGVEAISVLCDEKYFGGSLENLTKAREATDKTPLLCKDFIVDEYQIYEARKYGADAILLIAGILSEKQIEEFLKVARGLGMDAICEVHTEEELAKVLGISLVEIIGINNRDLRTFKVDLGVTAKLVAQIPAGKIIVSESGIGSAEDIASLPEEVDAVLVGTAIMKSSDVAAKVRELQSGRACMLKICGVRGTGEAEFCEEVGVDFVGLNFVPSSKRCVSLEKAGEICGKIKKMKKVGVFQNQDLAEVNDVAEELDLDYIQLSGDEDEEFVKGCCRPVIKAVSVREAGDEEKARAFVDCAKYLLLDGPEPGSGKGFDLGVLQGGGTGRKAGREVFVAGGIDPENVCDVVRKVRPLGVDIASGVETDGQIDLKKIQLILNKLKSC